MTTPMIMGLVALGLALIVGVVAFALYLRYRSLSRRVGSFECAISENRSTWRTGAAVFGSAYISWYPAVSFTHKPAYSFSRSRMVVERVDQQDTAGGSHVATISCNGTTIYLGTSQEALYGLTSWLESASPREEPTSI